MDFSSVCRTCLGKTHLNPIFNDDIDARSCSAVVFITTGLKVEKNDGLPQQMCQVCTAFLNNAMEFRQKCKDAEIQLLKLKTAEEPRESDVKEIKINTEQTDRNKKRKKSKDSETSSVKIKIELDKSDSDDDTPLMQLGLSHFAVAVHRDFKIETQFDTINVEKQESNKECALEVKNDDKIAESEENESKYVTEYLDLHFDSNSDAEDQPPRDNMAITEYRMELNEYDINNVMKSSKSDTEMSKYEIEISKYDSKMPSSKISKHKTKTSKYDMQIYIDSDTDLTKYEKSLLEAENIPFIMHNNLKRVTCKICQQELSYRSIQHHLIKRHPGVDIGKIKCDLCDNYILKERMERHRILRHGKDCFRCAYCKNEYDSKEVLVNHVTMCTAKKRNRKFDADKRKELMVECEVCNKSMQKASLKVHQQIQHAGLGPVCDHCGRRFGNKHRLGEHLRAKHGYDKFKCTLCAFVSASAEAMRNHERRHRGEKPFVCEQCDAKFHSSHLLAQHKQSHRTEKIMKCDQCPAAFKANNTLHNHKITCHDNSLYPCPVCGRTYKCRQYVARHVRAVHRRATAAPSPATPAAVTFNTLRE